MKRFLVALASGLVGVALTAPYAVLKFHDLPPPPKGAVNAPPGQVTGREQMAVAECCVVFYAVTYFVGRRIYVALGRRQELAELQAFSGGHMALLHAMAGTFMVVCPLVERPVGAPLARFISVAIGSAMLCSALRRAAGWVRARLAPDRRQSQDRIPSDPLDGR